MSKTLTSLLFIALLASLFLEATTFFWLWRIDWEKLALAQLAAWAAGQTLLLWSLVPSLQPAAAR